LFIAESFKMADDKHEALNAAERDSTDSKHDAKDAIIAEAGEILAAIDPKAESRLVWKFDLRILPVLAVMYLFNSLDKSNLGNAKTAGLEKDLKLGDHGYNIILSVFFVPYVLTAPFLGILGKKYGPNKVLPCMMFSFGSFTLLVASVKNFGGIMTLRWFLGMSESAFFPLVSTCFSVCPKVFRHDKMLI
jgi:sugar phosphate permease